MLAEHTYGSYDRVVGVIPSVKGAVTVRKQTENPRGLPDRNVPRWLGQLGSRSQWRNIKYLHIEDFFLSNLCIKNMFCMLDLILEKNILSEANRVCEELRILT